MVKDDRHSRLLKAITDRDITLAKEILLTKPSVESQNAKGFNSLQLAIKYNMTEICEDILSLYKSKINLSNNLKRDVLHLAIKRSNLEIIKMLVAKIGANKITNIDYLLEASRFNNNDKGKAVYDYIYKLGIENLHINDLLRINVDIDTILKRIENDKIKIDHSILGQVILHKDVNYFKPIYNIAKTQGFDVNSFCPDADWTILYESIYEPNSSIISFLCNDPDININKGSQTETPFYMVCESCRDESIIKLLLDKGADPNITPEGYRPALFHLLGYECTDLFNYVVQKGANTNVVYRDDDILQFYIKHVYSPFNHNHDFVNLLISYVDINRQDDMGNTTLMLAVQNEFDSIVEALIKLGADPTIKNILNKTVYDYATDYIRELLPEIVSYDNVLYEEDPRIFTKQFNLKVFDIVNFDNIELNEFVKNKENIIYFIQDETNSSLSLYGMTRKNLRKCSKTNDNICTFPTGHTIDADEAFKFMLQDFTLFQLTKKNVKCFTCQKFEEHF